MKKTFVTLSLAIVAATIALPMQAEAFGTKGTAVSVGGEALAYNASSAPVAAAPDNKPGKSLRGEGSRILKEFGMPLPLTAIWIESRIAVEVTVVEGPQAKIRITGFQNHLDYLRAQMEGSVLMVGSDVSERGSVPAFQIPRGEEIRIEVVVPGILTLQQIKVDYLGKLNIIRPYTATNLTVEIGGMGELNLGNVNATTIGISMTGMGKLSSSMINVTDRINLSASGMADISLVGTTRLLQLQTSGMTNGTLRGLRTEEANCEISGMSDCSVCVTRSIRGSVSGMSNLTYYTPSHPVQVNVSISGMSKANARSM